jgi:ABC-type long-subunit fatty acid transport system fused permease/ATPase subunit
MAVLMIVIVVMMVMVPVGMAVEVVMTRRPMAMVMPGMLVVMVVLMAFAGEMIQAVAGLFRRLLRFANQRDGDGFGRLVATAGGAHGDLVLRLRNSILG